MPTARMMLEMTVRDVEEGLRQTQTIIVPVGILEQHGYHLPLSVDIYNAVELARRASGRTGCFVAPPVHYNFSGGTLPGTINISPPVFSLMLMDILQSLVMQGFRRILILLGHAGSESQAAARDAAHHFQRLRPPVPGLVICVVPFTQLSPTIQQAMDSGDYHAGFYETSLMLYWKPEMVRMHLAAMDENAVAEMMRRDPDAYAIAEKRTVSPFEVPRVIQDPRIRVGVMGDFVG
ncbi:MAG: creatininase family protein, partial [Armatimonadota bacterium]